MVLPRFRALIGASVCLLAGALWAPLTHAQTDAELQPLVSQAHYWEDRGRYDLAREAWLKLLRVQPDNTEALVGLGLAEARSNRPAAAQVYLDRLRETSPKNPAIAQIEAAIEQGAIDRDKLAVPRGLARQGRYEEAAEAYRKLFGDKIPGGRLGLEYYQTLAGVEGKWGDARTGIEGLVRDYPNDPLYRLALAQHLTYREETRRDGISRLAELADSPAVSTQARQAWRQALLWLSTDPGDRRYYQAYLDKYGSDAEIQARLGEVRDAIAASQPQANPRLAKVQAAYEALNEGDLDQAAVRFEALIQADPRDSDGLGGLGIVRLRQQRFAEAASLLQRATAADPGRAQRWKEALGSARFYALVQDAETARRAGELVRAEQLLRNALTVDGVSDDSDVRSSLADILAEQFKTDEAERLYLQVLAKKPGNVNAARGLINLYARNGRTEQALAYAERLTPEQREQIGGLGPIKAQALRDQATKALETKDKDRAESLLKQALLLDPNSVWVRLDLARLYQQQGRVREANTLIDGVLDGNPRMADALFVKALLLSEQQRWYEALQVMEEIPLSARDRSMVSLQKRLWIRYQTERAAVYARYGRVQDAADMLRLVETQVDGEPELLGALATAYAEVGDEGRALGYIREALSSTSDPDPGLRTQYAALLFKLRQDAEFEVVVEDLAKRRDLTQAQSIDLANLRIAYRLRQADLIREEGNLARAYDYLAPLLQVNPNDPRLLMALARLYNDSQEYERSAEIYARVLEVDPENLDAYKGAIGAALAGNDLERADSLLNQAFALDPQNPRLFAFAGRLARARGEDGRALELYQKALALDAQQGSGEFGGRYAPQLYLLDPGSAAKFQSAPPPTRAPAGVYWPSSSSTRQPAGAARAQPMSGQAAHGGYLLKVAARRPLPPDDAADDASVERGIRPSIYALDAEPAEATPEPAVPAAPGFSLKMSTHSNGERVVREPDPAWRIPRLTSAAMQYSCTDLSLIDKPQRAAGKASEHPPPAEKSTKPPSRPADSQARADSFSCDRYKLPPPLLATTPSRGPAPAQLPAEKMQALPAASASMPAPADSRPVLPAYPVADPAASRSLRRFVPPANPAPAPLSAETLPPASGPRMTQDMGGYAGDPALRNEVLREMADIQGAGNTIAAPVVRRTNPALLVPGFAQREAPPTRERTALLNEINDINSKRSPYAGLGVALRRRDGQSGLGKLLDIELPVEASIAGTQAGRFTARAVPVFLDAGAVSGTDVPLFGAMALVDDPETYRFPQDESGVAVAGVYSIGSLRLDVGSSPLGFPVENMVGGLLWQPQVDNLSFKIDLSRRSVTDSLLSYAGTYDPATGRSWGGISKTGGRLDVAYDLGQYGVYANGGYHVLDGQNVDENNVFEAGGGFYARGIDRRGLRLTYGVNLTTFFYEKNRRYYSLGHGGYFSPQFYMSLGVPFEITGSRDRFSWRIGGAIGLQAFKEDGAPLYPNDAGLQAAVQAVAGDDEDILSGYSDGSQSGVGYNFGGALEYLIAPQLSAGALLSLDNAKDYNESLVMGYVRYWFSPQPGVAAPPKTLPPYFNFGSDY